MSDIRFIPKAALSSKKVFAAYMSGDPSYTGFSSGGTLAPYVSEEIMKRDDWVWFGTDNLWGERALELAENCIPLSRCIEIGQLFIAGSGVKFVDKKGEEIPAAQERFQEWVSETSEEEFMERIARDVAFLNSFSYDVTPLNGGRRVGRIRHRDVMRVRLGKADAKGVIKDTYWSADWIHAMRKSRSASAEIYVPRQKPLLDLTKNQPIATAYVRRYKNGRDYYGEPWWEAGITDAENHVEVGRFNNTQLKTGFRGAMHLHYTTDKTEKELDALYDKLTANYIGSMGDGVFITFGIQGEPVIVTPLERGDHAGELDEMRSSAEQAVLSAYGIPKIIYGLDDVKTGLDGQGTAIQKAFEKFQKTWVEPRQSLITRELTKLMIADGIEVWDTHIEKLEAIEDDDLDMTTIGAAYMASVTKNEHRTNVLGMDEITDPEWDKPLNDKAAVPVSDPNAPQPKPPVKP